ncbi:class I adenylate-forming enzyme family protein [Nocardioides zeae]|uniref:Class I adenylate-forming enzyme family protein n=1 Tax=Nocardioides imazamoxiresistens TaxID=3231893 RepID=A0ABU3PSL0_9ACTN|nr:class I adenylate-forming enzyme family protein [Nocardioides zeae]MDT9592216.1 class I adenylate-forming enzyme family protein [Nocardioides zeae]
MNIASVIHRAARRRPDAVALRHGDSSLTYAELVDAASRFAAYLRGRGVRPGDRVGVLMHNQPEWVVAMLGTWQAGACLVPYNYLFHPSALRHATLDADVRLVVAPAVDADRLHEALEGLEVLAEIVTVGHAPGTTEWSEALSGPADHTVEPRFDGDDAVLMYTSGSTGNPKGVRQTHRNIAAVCEATNDWWSISEEDHALVCTPLFHVGGLQLVTLPLLVAGGTVTLRRWKVAEWLDDAVTLEPTVVALVPAMMIDIVNHLGSTPRPLPSIRVCAIGGSALPRTRLQQLTELTDVVAVNIYGQTEQMGLSISEPIDEDRREGSLGRPLAQIVATRIAVDTPQGYRDAAVGEVGELWVRGDAVTPGYWQLPDTNAAKFVDGWFRTSDLVRADDDGYLYYVDRADDMIISGGENVYPQMVEGHLAACPLVAEVAVIGTRHERFSQQVTAIIVPTSPDVTAEDIAAYCDNEPNLRGLQRPRRIEIVDVIPRTATNKVDRPTLKRSFV